MMKPGNAASALPFGKEVTHGKFTGHRKGLSRRIAGTVSLGWRFGKQDALGTQKIFTLNWATTSSRGRSRMEEIKQADPAAVVVNGYYSGYLGEDMNLDELTAGVRRHYENGYSNVGGFIEAHDGRLPPELIEEARAAAHAAGLRFSEKAYRDGEEPDPYNFDGSMSMEDYELMHRMIENERSERMAETILSGYSF